VATEETLVSIRSPNRSSTAVVGISTPSKWHTQSYLYLASKLVFGYTISSRYQVQLFTVVVAARYKPSSASWMEITAEIFDSYLFVYNIIDI
jgi:hypothetical protein